jgi:hypothetical protein
MARERWLAIGGSKMGFTTFRRELEKVEWVMTEILTYLLTSLGNGIGSL